MTSTKGILLFLTASAAVLLLLLALVAPEVLCQTRLPGTDASDKLEAAGTLLRLLDTALFKWGARIFSGICVLSAAWSIKEQRFGVAVVCIIGAIIFGTAPKWVANIFEIGASDTIFGLVFTTPFWSFMRKRNLNEDGVIDAYLLIHETKSQ